MAAEDGRSGQRIFVQSNAQGNGLRTQYVARDRPLTLVAVERSGKPILYGFVAGIRPEPDAELHAPKPTEHARPWIDWGMPDQALLILINADDSSTVVPLAEIVRLYPPNRMALQSRLTLLWQRLGPGWRARRNQPEALEGEYFGNVGAGCRGHDQSIHSHRHTGTLWQTMPEGGQQVFINGHPGPTQRLSPCIVLLETLALL